MPTKHFNGTWLWHNRKSQWVWHVWLLLHKKECCVKAHHKSKFIPNASLFLRLVQMNLRFVAISYTAWRNIENKFVWIHSSGVNLWNEWLQLFLFIFRLNLSWYHIHPTLTSTDLILTRTIGIQWCIQSSNFWRKKKPNWQTGCEAYSYCHKQSRANSWSFENVGFIQAVFYQKYSMRSRDFVTVCSYDDLSFKVCASKDNYNAIIVSDVSTLWAAIKKDVHQGIIGNTNLLCELMKIPRIHLLAELFECKQCR